MREKKSIVQLLLDRCALEEEDLAGKPLVEILGDGRLLVENHQGIVQYGLGLICIRVSYGTVSVAGSNLKLRHAACRKLLITGQIDTVSLHRGKCK